MKGETGVFANVPEGLSFGKFLKTYRTKLELSQRDLALLADVQQPVIARAESGRSKAPGSVAASKIAQALDLKPAALLCVFRYPEYEQPAYWLGKNYNENSDYINIMNAARIDIPEKKPVAKAIQTNLPNGQMVPELVKPEAMKNPEDPYSDMIIDWAMETLSQARIAANAEQKEVYIGRAIILLERYLRKTS